MGKHQLETIYGLTAHELLDAMAKRFRLRAALEGAVAEIQMEIHIRAMVGGVVKAYEEHDLDGKPDFSIWIPGRSSPIRAETKNVRESSKRGGEAYRVGGKVVAYKVETQKTRASMGDPSSRYYGVDQFEVLGVCLGKKTGRWSDFLFARTRDLQRHAKFPHKLSVFQKVPLIDAKDIAPWYTSLEELIRRHFLPQS